MPESDANPPFQSLGLNQPAPAGDPPPVENLQFQRAEYADAPPSISCTLCNAGIQDSYYHVAGAVACPSCALIRRDLQGSPEGRASFLKAALYGFGAAVAGSIIYALVSLTGFQFGIVAILVGIMVGKSIRYATKGRTTRAYQVLAVVLTYGAITTSHVPAIIAEAVKQVNKEPAGKQQEAAKAAPTGAGAAVAALAGAVAVLAGVALVLPVLVIFDSPFNGLLNLLIIGIGLHQAWKLTKPDEDLILGPYTVESK